MGSGAATISLIGKCGLFFWGRPSSSLAGAFVWAGAALLAPIIWQSRYIPIAEVIFWEVALSLSASCFPYSSNRRRHSLYACFTAFHSLTLPKKTLRGKRRHLEAPSKALPSPRPGRPQKKTPAGCRTKRYEKPLVPAVLVRAHLYVAYPPLTPNMAIYHYSATVIRRSAGRSATAAAAYRAGIRIEDKKHRGNPRL